MGQDVSKVYEFQLSWWWCTNFILKNQSQGGGTHLLGFFTCGCCSTTSRVISLVSTSCFSRGTDSKAW